MVILHRGLLLFGFDTWQMTSSYCMKLMSFLLEPYYFFEGEEESPSLHLKSLFSGFSPLLLLALLMILLMRLGDSVGQNLYLILLQNEQYSSRHSKTSSFLQTLN